MKVGRKELSRIFLDLEQVNQKALNEHLLLSTELNNGLLELYLMLGADPNTNNNEAMKTSVKKGNLNNIKLLHKYGADIEVDLMESIQQNELELVEYFFKSGAKVKESYLNIAIRKYNYDMVKLILKYGKTVSKSHMQTAVCYSMDMVNLLFPYTGNMFPEGTFDDGESEYGYITVIPADVLKYVLEHVICNLRYSNHIISYALGNCIRQGCYERVEILVNYSKKYGLLSKLKDTRGRDLSFFETIVNVKNTQEFNKIIAIMKENGILSNYLPLNAATERYIYEIGTIETLQIYGVNIRKECFRPAIKSVNEDLIQSLLKMNLVPGKEDEELAYHVLKEYSAWPDKEEKAYNIFKMIVKAVES
ncbi:MAG: hypothetical protein HFJ25_06125 [Clostridia bacterium]|nr:hypothetical protein [Clostridia bacterium]